MKRKIFTAIIALLTGFSVTAQQQAQYTQYMFNKSYIDPSATGLSRSLCVLGTARYQWMGVQDYSGHNVYPRTYQVAVESPLYSIRSGLGASFEYDQAGFETNMDFRVNYAYHFNIKKNHTISLGVALEALYKTINYAEFHTFDPGDPVLSANSKESGLFPDIGFGLSYYLKDKFYISVSGMQLLSSSADIGGGKYQRVRHYYFMTGYNFLLKKTKTSEYVLMAGLLAKSTLVSTQAELDLILKINDRYWAGGMYRWNDAAGIIAGVKIANVSIGVSYDFTLSKLSKAGSIGSPEILIRYCLPVSPKIKMKGYYNPRYM